MAQWSGTLAALPGPVLSASVPTGGSQLPVTPVSQSTQRLGAGTRARKEKLVTATFSIPYVLFSGACPCPWQGALVTL